MTTDEQLRSALYAREQHAGSIEPILARVVATQPRRRLLAPALVAALVLVLAATTVAVTHHTNSAHTQTGTNGLTTGSRSDHPLPLRALTFALVRNAGVAVTETDANAAEQSLQLHDASTRLQLLVYAANNLNATPFALRGVQVGDAVPGLESIKVQGHPGYIGTLSDPRNETPGTADYPDAAIAWQYRPDAWAVLEPNGRAASNTELLRLARKVDFSATTPLRTAVTLSKAPDGMSLIELDATYPHGNYERSIAAYATPDGARQIWVSVEQISDGPPPTGRPITVGTRTGRWSAYSDGGGKLVIALGHGQALSVWAEIGTLTLAQALTIERTCTVVGQPDHLNTWLPAAKLP